MDEALPKDFRPSDVDSFDIPGEVERRHTAMLSVMFLVAQTNLSMRAIPPEADLKTGKKLPPVEARTLNIGWQTRYSIAKGMWPKRVRVLQPSDEQTLTL